MSYDSKTLHNEYFSSSYFADNATFSFFLIKVFNPGRLVAVGYFKLMC